MVCLGHWEPVILAWRRPHSTPHTMYCSKNEQQTGTSNLFLRRSLALLWQSRQFRCLSYDLPCSYSTHTSQNQPLRGRRRVLKWHRLPGGVCTHVCNPSQLALAGPVSVPIISPHPFSQASSIPSYIAFGVCFLLFLASSVVACCKSFSYLTR